MSGDRPKKREREQIDRLSRARLAKLINPREPAAIPPAGAVMADPTQLAHNNTYGRLPQFYVDKIVVCRDCGTEELWRAERQKWWYEVAKGNINTDAVYCRACRQKMKARKSATRRIHLEGLAKKSGK